MKNLTSQTPTEKIVKRLSKYVKDEIEKNGNPYDYSDTIDRIERGLN